MSVQPVVLKLKLVNKVVPLVGDTDNAPFDGGRLTWKTTCSPTWRTQDEVSVWILVGLNTGMPPYLGTAAAIGDPD